MGNQYDYGGDAHRTRKKYKTGLGNRRSFRCLSCNKLRYVLRSELGRAANVRCLECGGALEETPADKKNENYQKPEKTKKSKDHRRRRCPNCGELAVTNRDLAAHLLLREKCLEYHMLTRSLFISGSHIVPGTVIVVKIRSARWVVKAMSSSCEVVEIFKSNTRESCRSWVYEQLGQVGLAR